MADNMSASEDTNINEKGAKLLAERKESPLVAKLTLGLGSLISLIVLAWAIELPLRLGAQWFEEQAMATCLGLTLAIIFIRYPFNGGPRGGEGRWVEPHYLKRFRQLSSRGR